MMIIPSIPGDEPTLTPPPSDPLPKLPFPFEPLTPVRPVTEPSVDTPPPPPAQ